MLVDKKVRSALQLKKLRPKFPPQPRVLSLEPEDYYDLDGEPALRIWIRIPEETTDEELMNGRAISQLVNAIHDSLLAHGVKLWPYTRFGKPSEIAAVRNYVPGDED